MTGSDVPPACVGPDGAPPDNGSPAPPWTGAAVPGVVEQIARRLLARGETVAVAETAAGGLISASLLALPGASAWFQGGAVAYSAAAKLAWLGLSPDSLQPGGAVSAAAAAHMAEAARRATGATWGLAEAGIAGPQTGRRSAKPPGLAYLAVAGPVARAAEIRTGGDDRTSNQRAFAAAALHLLAAAVAAV